jgi:hypothetical protein
VSELAHIPAPTEATSLGDWHFFEESCGHQCWVRYFGGRRWTVKTTSLDPVEIEIVGSQFSDGSIERRVCLEGALDLNTDEALMLAATLTRAAEELERVQGGVR